MKKAVKVINTYSERGSREGLNERVNSEIRQLESQGHSVLNITGVSGQDYFIFIFYETKESIEERIAG